MHIVSSASALGHAVGEDLNGPEVTSPDECVQMVLKIGKETEEIEMQYPDLIVNELKEHVFVMRIIEKRSVNRWMGMQTRPRPSLDKNKHC